MRATVSKLQTALLAQIDRIVANWLQRSFARLTGSRS
jgi:hypothetical protein